MNNQKPATAKLATIAERSISFLFSLLAGIMILYSGYVLYDQLYTKNAAFSQEASYYKYKPVAEIEDEETPLSSGVFADINEDYVAWLTLDNTVIDYPVMQGENDLYYASHDVYGNTSLTGSIYLSYESQSDFTDNYNVIYGHHIDNGAMFGSLDNYIDPGYLTDHATGTLITNRHGAYDLEVFAALRGNAYSDMIYQGGDRDLGEIRRYLAENALYYDADIADSAKKVVILSTCADVATDGRLVIYAKMSPGRETVEIEDTATPQAKPAAAIDDSKSPLWFLQPEGQAYGYDAWALLNLILLICTAYILLPVFHIRAKYGRRKKMASANDLFDEMQSEENADNFNKEEAVKEYKEIREESREALPYNTKQFTKRFRTGIILETVILIAAIICFILTEDMRLPMTLIDRYTLIMLLFFIVMWAADVRLIRYRAEEKEKAEEKEEDKAH